MAPNEGRGAFLLASDGGLDADASRDGSEEPRLPMDAPTCLKKVYFEVRLLYFRLTCEEMSPLQRNVETVGTK